MGNLTITDKNYLLKGGFIRKEIDRFDNCGIVINLYSNEWGKLIKSRRTFMNKYFKNGGEYSKYKAMIENRDIPHTLYDTIKKIFSNEIELPSEKGNFYPIECLCGGTIHAFSGCFDKGTEFNIYEICDKCDKTAIRRGHFSSDLQYLHINKEKNG